MKQSVVLSYFAPLFLGVVSFAQVRDVEALRTAGEINVGIFCLSEIPRGVITVGPARFLDTGTWYPVTIKVQAGSGPKPNVFFFRSAPKPAADGRPRGCAAMQNEALVKGRVNSSTIRALFKPRVSDTERAQWYVGQNDLSAEFGQTAEAQLAPLYGGSVVAHDAKAGVKTIKGRLLWITNPQSDILFDPSKNIQQGILNIATTDVVISKAQLRIGGTTSPVDLACLFRKGAPNDGNVSFTINVSTGLSGIAAGECSSLQKVDLPSGDWNDAGIHAHVKTARSGKITLVGDKSKPKVTVADLEVDADLIEFPATQAKLKPSHAITAASLSGPVKASQDFLEIETPTWTSVRGTDVSVEFQGGVPISGVGDLNVPTFSADHCDVELSLKNISIPVLSSAVRAQISSATLRIVGPPGAPSVSGTIGVTTIQLAALGLRQELQAAKFESEKGVRDGVTFSFDWNVQKPTGSIDLGDPNGQNIRLSGKLKTMHLKGSLHVTAGGEPEVAVPAGGMVVDASMEASVSPLVLGSPVRFLGAAVTLASPTGFNIKKQGSNGSIDLTTGVLLLATPTLAFANPDQGFIVQSSADKPFRTEGSASLRFDVATGHAKLHNGKLVLENVQAKALDLAKNVSIGGITLVSPLLTLAKLSATVSEGQGSVHGEGFSFDTQEATHQDPPTWRVRLTPGAGLRIPQFDARIGDTEKSLKLEDAALANLVINGVDAEYRSVDGFQVAGKSFSLSADMLSEKAITRGKLHIGDGAVRIGVTDAGNVTNAKGDFSDFDLNVDGAKDQLVGNGGIRLRDISVGGRYRLPIGRCSAESGWRVTGALDIGSVDLNVGMRAGKLSGNVDVSNGKMYAVNDGRSSCEWDQDYTIAEATYIVYNGCPLTGNCAVRQQITPAIKGQIHWIATLESLQASGGIQLAKVSLSENGKLVVCVRQMALNPPLIVANYNPTIREGGFLQTMLRDIINGAAALVESSLASSIGTADSLISYVSGALGLICTQ